MSMRTLIVDDEPLARERIRTFLADEPEIELIGECGNGPEALAAIRERSPDLVFLDVQMPGMDGFQVLRELNTEKLPLVIFVTAYDRHALQAFEVHALDYLLKPFKPTRFKETVARAREAFASRKAGVLSRNMLELLGKLQPQTPYLARISVKHGERVSFVRTEDVDFIESAGNYVVVHIGKETHVVRETLTSLSEQLAPKQFLRISRSVVVNVDRIKELQPLFKGDYVVVLLNGKQLTMTRGIREVQEFLKFS